MTEKTTIPESDEQSQSAGSVAPGAVEGQPAQDVVAQEGDSQPDAGAEAAGIAGEPEVDPAVQKWGMTEEERQARRAEADAKLKERIAAAEEEALDRAQKSAEAVSATASFSASYELYHDVASTEALFMRDQRPSEPAEPVEGEDAVEGDGDQEYFDRDRHLLDVQCDEDTMTESQMDAVTFSRRVALLTQAVVRNPVQRELFYKVLTYCTESRLLRDVEAFVGAQAEFKRCAVDQYHFIKVLEKHGGLERFELDEQGEVVTPERKEGLTEDEIDDLVWDYAFMTTTVGMAVVERHTPRARLLELMQRNPEREEAYVEVLEFLSEEPRTYAEVEQLLTGRECLVRYVDGEPQRMQPSVYLDKLQQAGVIEWTDGWQLAPEGRAYLEEVRKAQAE